MATERKCPNCQTWNKEKDFCAKCGEVLSPKIIEDHREKEREKRRYRPPTKFEEFIKRWQNSRFWLLRVLYRILYTIGVIFFAIASFFAYLAATPNG